MDSLSGGDLDAHTLHLYLRDSTFVEYFNAFLLLPAFSSKVFYNEVTGYFEQVLGGGIQRDGGEERGREAVWSSTSMSTLYLTDDCIGGALDKKQCWQWVLDHRLPLFVKSDLFSEFKLCKILASSPHPLGGRGGECVPSEVGRIGRGRSQSAIECTSLSSHDVWPLLSTKRGMYSLWRFLQGTAGERSWLCWLDAERLKYCSSHQEQMTLLRGLRERYLVSGAPLELPTDTKFRVGMAGLRVGGVASVQSLQDMLAENLRHYWCHRFLLHCQYHKHSPYSRTRPHTSLGLLNTTHQNNRACLTVHYPRVETPLVPSKTPTFCRISKKYDRQSLGGSTRRTSLPQSVCGSAGREMAGPGLARERPGSVWGRARLLERERESPADMEEGERRRGGRESGGGGREGGRGRREGGRGGGEGERGEREGGGGEREDGGGRREGGRGGREGERGGREGGRKKRSRKHRSTATHELLEKSSLIFKRNSYTPNSHKLERDTSSTSLEMRVDWSCNSGGVSGSGSRLPQSLRQSYTSTPLCRDDDDNPSRGDCLPPSRSAEYHNLTRYTPHHLPNLNTHTTTSQHTLVPLSSSSTACNILSISGTPILPPSPPHRSPYSHMLNCLASEHRKAGGHFEEHLKSVSDRVPLNCLLFWREVQEYKALFVSPSFNPATVETKAKTLYSRYVVESSPTPLSLPPSLPSLISPLLTPPYDDLFDEVEEHTLSLLLTHWETMCRDDESTLQKVDRVSLSRTGSASRRTCRAPSTTSHTALDELTEEVDIGPFNNGTSPSPHSQQGTPPPHPSSHPHSSQPSSHTSPVHHLTTSTPHTFTPSQLPPPMAVSLDDIVKDPNELDNFKLFLNEHRAAQHLMCWMEIEAFRGIPSKDGHLRDHRARQLRERYFSRRYLFGPHSPASREAQRQIVAAGGGPSARRLPARPKTPVFREAQKHIRAKLEKKWIAEFVQTPEYKARSGAADERGGEGEGGAGTATERGTQLELKFAHSHEALMLRKALQCESSRELFLSFLSVRATSGTNSTADVEFWLEVQRFKDMCHSHCDKQVLRDKLTAMKECYLTSSVPPKLHIDIPQHMADAILKKEVGPYVFREAQATVFRHLYGYWQDYQVMAHDLTSEEIAPAIDKMKREMMELRRQGEEREREMKEREQMMMRFELETAAEREERIRREREKQLGEATVNFTLVKPHPKYTYHTSLPGVGD